MTISTLGMIISVATFTFLPALKLELRQQYHPPGEQPLFQACGCMKSVYHAHPSDGWEHRESQRLHFRRLLQPVSAPKPPVTGASCAINTRPVLDTERIIVSLSRGFKNHNNNFDVNPSSTASFSAASRARGTIIEYATIVRSRPSRLTSANWSGMV